jgi:hypothetical protein
LQANRFAIAGFRPSQLALLQQNVAQVVLGLGQLGTQPQGLTQQPSRLLQLARTAQGRGQVTEHVGVLGDRRKGTPEYLNGFRGTTLGRQCDAQVVQRQAIIGSVGQGLAMASLGLGGLAQG